VTGANCAAHKGGGERVYVRWLRSINGAESAVIDGKTSLEEIYASERKISGGEIVKNFM
jgi:hypothetical protein